jgi:hypothetical protein
MGSDRKESALIKMIPSHRSPSAPSKATEPQMLTSIELETWEQLEEEIKKKITMPAPVFGGLHKSNWLFRGQGNAKWNLASTIQREVPKITELAEYFHIIGVAKAQIETFTAKSWENINFKDVQELFSEYDPMGLRRFPAYEYLVYLRHHGFPSPLLDWSRSPYVAVYFACKEPKGEKVSLFAYQEYTGAGKVASSNQPRIHSLGPYIRSHPRHFLQQCEYTIALKFIPSVWQLAEYSEILDHSRYDQDQFVKYSIPSSEAERVVNILDKFNINVFSLFQSEESLLKTMAFRHFLPWR